MRSFGSCSPYDDMRTMAVVNDANFFQWYYVGWFDMEAMMTFKRLSSLTQDPSVVLTALAKSPQDLLQVCRQPVCLDCMCVD